MLLGAPKTKLPLSYRTEHPGEKQVERQNKLKPEPEERAQTDTAEDRELDPRWGRLVNL